MAWLLADLAWELCIMCEVRTPVVFKSLSLNGKVSFGNLVHVDTLEASSEVLGKTSLENKLIEVKSSLSGQVDKPPLWGAEAIWPSHLMIPASRLMVHKMLGHLFSQVTRRPC